MVSVRRKKRPEPSQSLLGPRRKGLFGKHVRSEDLLKESSPRRLKGLFGRNKPKPNDTKKLMGETIEYHGFDVTPPTTPTPIKGRREPPNNHNKSDMNPSSPVRNVTVKKQLNNESTPNRDRRIVDNHRDDSNTVVSDLTNPQEMGRNIVYYNPGDDGPATAMKQNMLRPTGSTATTTASSQQQEDILTRVLGLVDFTCFSTVPMNSRAPDNELRENLSFLPEWGMAPSLIDSQDEDDEDDSYRRKGGQDYERQHKGGKYEDYDTYASKTYEASRKTDNKTAEENFEMVLEDEANNLAHKMPNRRGWLSKKKGNKSTASTDAVLGIVKRETQRVSETPPADLVAKARPTSERQRHVIQEEEKKEEEALPIVRTPPRRPVTPVGRSASPDPPASPKQYDMEDDEEKPMVQERPIERTVSTSPPPSNAKAANPAMSFIRKARKVRERKRAADKEKRYNRILRSLDNKNKESLPTVVEAVDEGSDQPVRVPGIQTEDVYLKASELLGSECIEENHQVLLSRPRANSHDNIHVPKSQHLFRTPSWREKLGLKRVGSAREEGVTRKDRDGGAVQSDPGTFSIQSAAAAIVRTIDPTPEPAREENQQKTTGVQINKPCWKPALDPKSGRTYYYHRITRKTTWTKPHDHEIVSIRSMGSDGGGVPRNDEDELVMRKKSPRDFDPAVWRKKEQIAKILTKMSTPNSSSVDRLVSHFEGREDELLHQLKDLTETKPFDEHVEEDDAGIKKKETPNARRKDWRDRSRVGFAGGRSVYSGFSGKLSDQTPQMKNTSSGKKPLVSAIREDVTMATSISSKQGLALPKPANSPARSSSSIPSNIPVPRKRELMVEEFSSHRIKAETFDTRRTARGTRTFGEWARPLRSPKPLESSTLQYDTADYLGDNEATDKDTESYSAAQDSISALSEPDPELDHKESVTEARRHALNDAIAREDSDLAAALSDGLRSVKANRSGRPRKERREWTQSELDRFNSENDWDAVTSYIADVRAKAKAEETSLGTSQPATDSGSKNPSTLLKQLSTSSTNSPVKRFGARSQLQHNGLNSTSSWDSSNTSYFSDDYYSTESYSYSEEERQPRRTNKEFAC